ncbi:unnamed protein product [Periconia digitata]|uniref:Uncharacterized protein n=1 Tax=Periconia digitata TaxID=1303443 RepID=A0A9W4U0P2_9PLEO|nr:unnamed protein product [Periconia digitata]
MSSRLLSFLLLGGLFGTQIAHCAPDPNHVQICMLQICCANAQYSIGGDCWDQCQDVQYNLCNSGCHIYPPNPPSPLQDCATLPGAPPRSSLQVSSSASNTLIVPPVSLSSSRISSSSLGLLSSTSKSSSFISVSQSSSAGVSSTLLSISSQISSPISQASSSRSSRASSSSSQASSSSSSQASSSSSSSQTSSRSDSSSTRLISTTVTSSSAAHTSGSFVSQITAVPTTRSPSNSQSSSSTSSSTGSGSIVAADVASQKAHDAAEQSDAYGKDPTSASLAKAAHDALKSALDAANEARIKSSDATVIAAISTLIPFLEAATAAAAIAVAGPTTAAAAALTAEIANVRSETTKLDDARAHNSVVHSSRGSGVPITPAPTTMQTSSRTSMSSSSATGVCNRRRAVVPIRRLTNTIISTDCVGGVVTTHAYAITSLSYAVAAQPTQIFADCEAKHAQACYHYSSAIRVNPSWATLTCPQEAATKSRDRLHAQATKVWKRQHKGKNWQNKDYRDEPSCGADEYPPAYLLSPADTAYRQAGIDSTGQLIRWIPQGMNSGAANHMWAGKCFTVPLKALTDVQMLDAAKNRNFGVQIRPQSPTSTEYNVGVTVEARPEFTITSWAQPPSPDDGLSTNPCWPRQITNDPGFALLTYDPYYANNNPPFRYDLPYAPGRNGL